MNTQSQETVRAEFEAWLLTKNKKYHSAYVREKCYQAWLVATEAQSSQLAEVRKQVEALTSERDQFEKLYEDAFKKIANLESQLSSLIVLLRAKCTDKEWRKMEVVYEWLCRHKKNQ